MAHTLRSLATDKIVKKVDGFRAHIKDIHIVDGFNVRIDDDELREHVASIAGSIASGQPIPAIEVWIDPDTGRMELVDGHCRYQAYEQYGEAFPEFDGWVSVTKFEGTSAQRKARIVTSNNQLKLLPVELGRVYLSLRDEHGMSRQEIASEVGRSLAHIDQMILLASASPEVIAAVEAGEISATEAVKLARDHGDDAPAELERRKEAAGGGKVTAKVAPKKAVKAEKKVGSEHFVSVAACALVDDMNPPTDGDLLEWLVGADFRVDLMADLISCVRELRESAKPLDADKQSEMEI